MRVFLTTRGVAASLALVLCAACGAKGDPLPPLRPHPARPEALLVTRGPGEPIRLRFTLPATNADGTPLDLTSLRVFAAMRPSTDQVPIDTDVADPINLIDTIDLSKPAYQGARTEVTPESPLANAIPGATVVWEDTSPAAMTPVERIIRYYVVAGVSRRGRRGPPSDVVGVPLGDLPASPAKLTASFTAGAIKLEWQGTTPAATYLVFDVRDGKPLDRALNAAPLAATSYDDARVEFGTERCYLVRAVEKVVPVAAPTMTTVVARGPVVAPTFGATLYSAPSNTVCITPRDVFPPPAPSNLTAVSSPGAVSLIWDPVDASDLAGYLVLRAEAPGEKLQPLFDTPITETTYKDTTAKAGTRYVYAIVAVDKATPANRSAESNRVEETGRN